MPKIREYGSPELNFQEVPVQGYGELRGGGDTARSFQRLGGAIEDVGNQFYQREVQEETSDVNANFSQLTAEVTEEIEAATQDGSINSEEYLNKLQPRIDGLSDGLSTPAARRSFERNAARLRAVAIKKSSRGQALVAGAKAEANVTSEIANYSSSLFSDPEGFHDNLDAMHASIDDQVSSGGLPAAAAEKLKLTSARDMAKAAVGGWARLDPDLAEKKLHSGQYDGYLNGDQKKEMQTYIDHQRTAKEAENTRAEAAQKRAEKAKGDAFMAQHLKEIVKGNLSTEQIMNAPGLKPEFKISLIKAVAKTAKDGGTTNPAVYTSIHQKMLTGEITDPSQFIDEVNKGRINFSDYEKLVKDIPNTPEGKAMVERKKAAFNIAKSEILQTGFSNFGSRQYTADSQRLLQAWLDDARTQEAELVKQGKSPAELYDPRSPHYIAGPEKFKHYKMSVNEFFSSQAKETLSKQPVFQSDDKNMRLPGETLEQWKARTSK